MKKNSNMREVEEMNNLPFHEILYFYILLVNLNNYSQNII